jgi:predicted regulator of Ras-like GTPase activity (Roadblock/LC7/MglB family)
LIISNEDGLPVMSRIKTGSPELEYFLSAIISTMACNGANIAEQLAIDMPEMIKLELRSGIMVIKPLQDQASCGILLKTTEDSCAIDDKLREFFGRVNGILFSG